GDVVDIEVYAKYIDTDEQNWTPLLNNLIAALSIPSGGIFIDGGQPGSLGNETLPFTPLNNDTEPGVAPNAYLNYIIIDRDFNKVIDMGAKPVTTAAREYGQNGAHERLFFDDIVVREAGHRYIYLSNEGEELVDVFFDDLKVEHVKSPIIQANDYYPFGLTFNSYQRENSIYNKYQYNSKELQEELDLGWLDYEARMYDYSLGRFNSIDAHTEDRAWITPYNYVQNNPITRVDPNALDDYYYRDGNVAFVIENDKDDRYYEQRENKDNASGYETVQIENPEVNPSSLESNNKTGYKYDKSDLRVRAALLSLGSGNVITASVLRGEKKGDFQPLTAHNYLKQVDERSARMMLFGATMFPAPPA